MYVEYGIPRDIDLWMALVEEVRWNFPGLETQEKLNEHRATVLKFMGKRQAICVKEGNVIAGVMLFSRGHNMICCLAVSPEYRRRGVASMLMDEALNNLDRTKEISVSTFRADDEKGNAPRALYEKYGFKSLGTRKGYYQDNNEDALIMWTENIFYDKFKSGYEKNITALKGKINIL